VSNGTSYAPYYAASATAPPTAVYPALAAAPPPAIQYSMPTTVDSGCGQQMLLVGNGASSTGQQQDRPADVRDLINKLTRL